MSYYYVWLGCLGLCRGEITQMLIRHRLDLGMRKGGKCERLATVIYIIKAKLIDQNEYKKLSSNPLQSTHCLKKKKKKNKNKTKQKLVETNVCGKIFYHFKAHK